MLIIEVTNFGEKYPMNGITELPKIDVKKKYGAKKDME